MTDFVRAVDVGGGTYEVLVNGTSVVYDDGTDPCCCDTCCEFVHCDTGSLKVLCNTSLGLTVGDVIQINGECYTYNGETTCDGGESTIVVGDLYANCQQCENSICPHCPDNPLPLSVTVTLSGVDAYGDSTCSAAVNVGWVVPDDPLSDCHWHLDETFIAACGQCPTDLAESFIEIDVTITASQIIVDISLVARDCSGIFSRCDSARYTKSRISTDDCQDVHSLSRTSTWASNSNCFENDTSPSVTWPATISLTI